MTWNVHGWNKTFVHRGHLWFMSLKLSFIEAFPSKLPLKVRYRLFYHKSHPWYWECGKSAVFGFDHVFACISNLAIHHSHWVQQQLLHRWPFYEIECFTLLSWQEKKCHQDDNSKRFEVYMLVNVQDHDHIGFHTV
jgi:hypothetical protein